MSTTVAPEPEPLWHPRLADAEASQLARFHGWVTEVHGAPHGSYAALQRWSTEHLDAFWEAITSWFDVRFTAPPTAVLGRTTMPGAEWFPGARLNYAEQALRHGEDSTHANDPAILHLQEADRPPREVSWTSLRRQVGALAAELRRLGIRPGDRVAAFTPNVPETVVALLACAAVGAVWSACPPEFGVPSAVSRFQQIDPVLLFAADGYRYGGRQHDRTEVVTQLRDALPTLRHVVHIPVLGSPPPHGSLLWNDLTDGDAPLVFDAVPFDHPLWVLFSSGTTGPPKAIVQGHGGIVLEHLKQSGLHLDLGPGDRFFWFTSTGWMMWNFLLSGLLVGASIVTYDGSPVFPDVSAQWRAAADVKATVFGTSAAYVMACAKAGVRPGADLNLSSLRQIGVTGSPLPPDGFRWVYQEVGGDLWLSPISGGTDICSAFAGGVPTLPVYAGELQAPALGVALEAWDADGAPLVGEVGELVVTRPLPSMPLEFWNDEDGSRYRESYFDMFPGVWRHGDWTTVTERGTVVVHGRSDSTLNRQGVRMGSADIHEVVERIAGVDESLVIGLEQPDGGYWMPLFVVLQENAELDLPLQESIRRQLREELSPRHVPDEIIHVPELPHTLTGKRVEVPVKRILSGTPVAEAVHPGSIRNPDSLGFFENLSFSRRGR